MIFTPLEILLIMAYVVLANSWAIFAISMNSLFHHNEPSIPKIIECYMYNVIGFPIALWIAILNTNTGRFDKFIKHPASDEKINSLSVRLNQANIENEHLNIALDEANAEIGRLIGDVDG